MLLKTKNCPNCDSGTEFHISIDIIEYSKKSAMERNETFFLRSKYETINLRR